MGYTTEFDGEFFLDKELTDAHYNYLVAFANIRHLERRANGNVLKPDPIRETAGLPYNPDYYVGDDGEGRFDDIIDINKPPKDVPGLYCQWVPTEDRQGISWDGGEKFYEYIEWLEYLIKHFLSPWGYTVSGVVRFRGEDFDDMGELTVEDNKVDMRYYS
jgi:hypothetical protein